MLVVVFGSEGRVAKFSEFYEHPYGVSDFCGSSEFVVYHVTALNFR